METRQENVGCIFWPSLSHEEKVDYRKRRQLGVEMDSKEQSPRQPFQCGSFVEQPERAEFSEYMSSEDIGDHLQQDGSLNFY